MARSALTIQSILATGVVITPVAANVDGNSIANDGKGARTWLRVVNGSGAPITVTVQTPQTVAGGLAVADQAVTVAAGVTKEIGPFPVDTYNQSDGTVYVDYSAVTTVTVAAVRIGS